MSDRPQAGDPRRTTLALSGLVLLLIGLVMLGLGGCGSGDEAAEQPAFSEQLSAAEQPGSETAEDAASFISLCANCHDRLDAPLDWRQERKLIFNHSAHFAVGIRCDACHTEFPHKPGKTLHVPLETCFTCHGSTHGVQGTLAPTECDACHTADIAKVTPDHNQDTWLIQPGTGLARHSRSALERPLRCKMCHEATFCIDCHKMEMPHPAGWLPAEGEQVEPGHAVVAAEDSEACLMCHESKSFCNDCHHSDFKKLADWSGNHRIVARETGAELCYECHEPPYCSECHVQVGKERGAHEGEG